MGAKFAGRIYQPLTLAGKSVRIGAARRRQGGTGRKRPVETTQLMRINGTNRIGSVASGGARRSGGARPAFPDGGSDAAKPSGATRAAQSIAGIDAIVTIQSVGDALSSKKRAVRRGNAMLDLLDELRIDLLSGDISSHKLGRLMRLVDEKLPNIEPGPVRDVLEEIELRARVEIAKRELS